VLSQVADLYRKDSDSGVHGAAERLLRLWGQHDVVKSAREEFATAKPNAERRWFLTREGHTMVLVRGPVEFLMGSPLSEATRYDDEVPVKRRIPRSFAISNKEVTVAQMLRHRKDFDYDKRISPGGEFPVNSVTWFEAAQYCNWLSKQEGIPESQWCYPDTIKYEDGLQLPYDYLHRTGYRLPTEAEWEYACRAGAVTSRSFGDAEDLLASYAWGTRSSLDLSMFAVGSLMPNALGLFDMHGNADEWCQDKYFSSNTAGDDWESLERIRNSSSRVIRGGSYEHQPFNLRSAVRLSELPATGTSDEGFRVVRTVVVGPG
jgi:formylglycine-generating enzyme required for sulfatase activity